MTSTTPKLNFDDIFNKNPKRYPLMPDAEGIERLKTEILPELPKESAETLRLILEELEAGRLTMEQIFDALDVSKREAMYNMLSRCVFPRLLPDVKFCHPTQAVQTAQASFSGTAYRTPMQTWEVSVTAQMIQIKGLVLQILAKEIARKLVGINKIYQSSICFPIPNGRQKLGAHINLTFIIRTHDIDLREMDLYVEDRLLCLESHNWLMINSFIQALKQSVL